MRESMGSSWTMQLMFGFTLLFVSFITVTISYSKAFRIKNEVISIIEKYGGYTDKAEDIINNYLQATGYTATGNCEYDAVDADLVRGVEDLSAGATTYNPRTRYSYCIRRETVNPEDRTAISDVYYEVTTFYTFNIPVLGRFATFAVKGKTTDMLDPNKDTGRGTGDLFK